MSLREVQGLGIEEQLDRITSATRRDSESERQVSPVIVLGEKDGYRILTEDPRAGDRLRMMFN